MITFITGTPGAGKTLYAISKLIRPLIGATLTRTTDDGETVTEPRTIYTNINGLQLDHELIGPGGAWEQDGKREWQFKPIGEGQGLRDWHQWAKPGSVIVYDEVQRVWPQRANGSPVPPDMAALDTHRHMGVDFILITQGANNVDRHLLALVGRHLHVRRMGNLPVTVVYEWDHCSKSLMYSKSLAKHPWRYDKSVFKLYKSADAHTKQPRRIPSLVFIVGLAVAAAAYFLPATYGRIVARAGGQLQETVTKADQVKPAEPKEAAPIEAEKALLAYLAAPGQKEDVFVPGQTNNDFSTQTIAPEFAGCGAMFDKCNCFTTTGKKVEKPIEFCQAETKGTGPKVDAAIIQEPPRPLSLDEQQLIQDVTNMKKRPPVPPLDWMAHYRAMDPVR